MTMQNAVDQVRFFIRSIGGSGLFLGLLIVSAIIVFLG